MRSYPLTALLCCGILFIMLWYNIELYQNSEFFFKNIHRMNSRRERKYITKINSIDSISNKLADGENVFFVETQNTTEHHLNDRQACSIESAALMNPNASVIIIFLTPEHHIKLSESASIEILREYKNVFFTYVNMRDFSRDTPLEEWIDSDKLKNSKFIVSHTSDVLRYLLLYKYSGIYLDTDVIVTYPYGDLDMENYACFESAKNLNGAILKLSGESGHQLAETLLLDLIENFDGTIWGQNGPLLLTRVIKRMCNIAKFSKLHKCQNFTILPSEKCYGVPWEQWKKFFEPNQLQYVRRQTTNSYFVHLWNQFSKTIKIEKSTKTGLNEIAEKFCPKIYESVDDYF